MAKTNLAKELREILGDGLQEHVVLRDLTTLKVGGVADYFYVAKTIDDLVLAVSAAWKLDVPYFILGAGGNIVVSDFGFPGLVIKNETKSTAFFDEQAQVIADSGVPVGTLIAQCISHGLSGLEFASGVPGTVGGFTYNGLSCWGKEWKDYIRNITLLFPPKNKDDNPKIKTVKPEFLQFGYHTSRLKEMVKRGERNIPVILTVRFQLARRRQEDILSDLRYFQKLRSERQPLGIACSGSFFANPQGFATPPEGVKDRTKASGWLLEQAGAKRITVGKARVSPKHANFVTNTGGATATEIRQLADTLREKVKEKFGIVLEEEVEYIGRW
jgi:UDP-N-acetylmuramate dehydrogenase